MYATALNALTLEYALLPAPFSASSASGTARADTTECKYIIYYKSGRKAPILDYEQLGDKIVLKLKGGGTNTIPKSMVDRIEKYVPPKNDGANDPDSGSRLPGVEREPQGQGGDHLYYRAPHGTSLADIKECANAMQERCRAHGYSAVTANVFEIRDGVVAVRLSNREGFSRDMRDTIETMSRVAAKDVECRTEYQLTYEERSKYKAGSYDVPQDDKAPRNGEWHREITSDFEKPRYGRGSVVLLRTDVRIRRQELELVKRESDGRTNLYYVLSITATKKLQKNNQLLASHDEAEIYILIDGKAQRLGDFTLWRGRMTDRGYVHDNYKQAWMRTSERSTTLLEAVIRNPMPTALLEDK